MANVDQETREMLQSFVSEAFDSLDTNEPIVENLHEEDNAESVNAIFRVFHTLKGLSGFFDMKVINEVTHDAETLLDIMRKQNKVQSEESISVIYTAFDFIRELLNRVNDEFTDESGREEAEDIKLIIRDMINGIESEEQNTEEEDLAFDDPEDSTEEEKNEKVEDETKQEDDDDSNDNDDDLLDDEMLVQYLNDSGELVNAIESSLLTLEEEPDNKEIIAKAFGDVHSLKGNSGFMDLSEIEEIAMEMETILDSLRSGEIEPDEIIISILLNNLGTPAKKTSEESKETESTDKSQKKEPEAEKEQKPQETETAAKKEPQEDKQIDKKQEAEKVEPKTKDKAPKTKSKPAFKKTGGSSMKMQKKDIRVETSKIDKLFDLVGELITIESMVTNNPEVKELNLPSFNKSANMLSKITRELQEITMSVRMMPLEGLFNKMKRLVRDVAIKMDKKINFTVTGQETEMDKNVIDEIADPLVHILRNAIDHGVEKPEVRTEKGKPPEGEVKLSARYEGNEILITVEDDGAGIKREKILEKAEEKGILQTDPEKMTDSDVFQLVFEPGFSTAQELTDISGRGVGMDVVKKNMEKLRGSIDVDSKVEEGSTFTLRIPLTLAIMEAMIIRIGESQYALPILNVTESFKVNMDDISETMDGLEIVKVRDEIMPVVRLYEHFGVEPDSTELNNGILIIIESRNKKVCLFADEIVGQQQAVVKSLTDYIGKVPGIMGCLILGDGNIGLILDVESLISMTQISRSEMLV